MRDIHEGTRTLFHHIRIKRFPSKQSDTMFLRLPLQPQGQKISLKRIRPGLHVGQSVNAIAAMQGMKQKIPDNQEKAKRERQLTRNRILSLASCHAVHLTKPATEQYAEPFLPDTAPLSLNSVNKRFPKDRIQQIQEIFWYMKD